MSNAKQVSVFFSHYIKARVASLGVGGHELFERQYGLLLGTSLFVVVSSRALQLRRENSIALWIMKSDEPAILEFYL